jgi:hypothetical protein
VFIGSSAEGLDVAREIELHLQDHAVPTIWKDGVFGPGSGNLETLMNAIEQYDFAVLVLSPDDLIESRGERFASPRDNVIFELGLFMGRLGRTRAFVVHEVDAHLKLPSDLAGISISKYVTRDNLSAALSPACTPIIKAIRSLGFLERRTQQQMRVVTREQEAQKSIIEQHQEFFDIVKYSISALCYTALWHIENGPEYIYNNHDEFFRRRMWFLTDSGYIEPIEANSFIAFDEGIHNKDLRQIAKLTPIGKYLVNLRGRP